MFINKNNIKVNEPHCYVYRHIANFFLILNEIWSNLRYQMLTVSADAVHFALINAR
jgi:hypothetical protein